MSVAGAFFTSSTVAGKARTIINVGGHGDCGFRSFSAGLVDNFILCPRLNKTLLNTVLRRHFEYFPRHCPQRLGLATPNQQMAFLLQNVPMPELIQALAYTLRQLAVDEMVAHPFQYPGAFVQHHEQTSPESMRKFYTWIDESSICALAKTLDVPVEVRLKTAGRELASPPFRYQSQSHHAATNPAIVIQLQNGHYQPCLLNADAFRSNVYHHQEFSQPAYKAVVDCDMPTILQQIVAAERHIVAEFERTHMLLTTMVAAGELTKAHLLDAYIKGMSTSDYLKGRVKYVDREHQSDFFSRAIDRLPSHSAVQTHDDAIVAELIYALSRAISVGHMNVEDVFSQAEAEQAGASHA